MLSIAKEIEFRSRINRLGWTLVIMIGAINLLASADLTLVSIFSLYGSDRITLVAIAVFDTLCYLGYFLIPADVFYLMSGKKPAEPIKFNVKLSKYLPLMILSGIGISQAANIFNDLFCRAIDYSLPMDDYSQYMTNPELIVMFMTVSLAPAFAEEVLFRGVVYTNLRPYGKTFAVITSAVIFSLMHQNAEQLFYTFVAGIVLALMYEASGSIWGSIFLHMFNNLYAVFQSAILYRYDETKAVIILYLAQSAMIFLGAISTICLIYIKKKRERAEKELKNQMPPEGVFGENRKGSMVSYDAPVPMGQAAKMLFKTPGMLLYIIASIALTLVAVFMYGGGGYAL